MSFNLRTDPEAAIRALVEMEGARWLERQKAGQFKGCSVFDAIEELGKIKRTEPADFSIRTVIYGQDGWNRYGVFMNGEVYFVELQAWGKEPLEKAKKLGFLIR
jgi:hypothetical protein